MTRKSSRLAMAMIFMLLVAVVSFSQPPTRIYGPTTNDQQRTIFQASGGTFGAFGNHIWYGDFWPNPSNDYLVYGFMEWTFNNQNLPAGSQIDQVELRFKAYPDAWVTTTHSTFFLYDVGMHLAGTGNERQLYLAMTSQNLIVQGTTSTVNGEEVFVTSSPVLLQKVQLALNSGRNYLDIGIKRDPEYNAGSFHWSISDPTYDQSSASLKVWFHPPQYNVQFKNDLNGASYGTIKATDHNGIQTDLSSGATLPLYWGDQTAVTAFSGKYQYNSNNWKYQSWTDGQPNDNQNPKTFAVTAEGVITAYFKPVYDVTVRNDLEGLEAGQLTYQGNPVNSGYTEQDVFWTYTRTFGAITPQTYNGYSYNFYQWNDGPTSPSRSVSVTSTQTYQAKYKAHLGSSISTATGNNGQRTLVQQGSVHHLVYQSAGHVWYARSTNFGATWSNEELVSNTTQQYAPNINPSIDVVSNGTVFVAYECAGTNGSMRGLIVMKKPLNSQWSSVIFEEYTASELRPVIVAEGSSGNPEKLLVVFKVDGSDPGLWYRYLNLPTVIGATKVSGTSIASRNPSLSWAGLAYEESNGIYYCACDWALSFSFQPRQLVSTNYINGRLVTNISNPSIASRGTIDLQYNRSPVMAWQAQDLVFSSYRPIFVRHPASGQNPPTFLLSVFDWGTSNARGRKPSVAMYRRPDPTSVNPDVSVVWQDDPSDPNGSYPNTVVVNKIGGAWGPQSTLATSTTSSSTAQGGDLQQTPDGGTLVAWTSTSGPPYPVTASERTNIGRIVEPPPEEALVDYGRALNIELASVGIEGLEGTLTINVKESSDATLRPLRELRSVRDDFLHLRARARAATTIPYTVYLHDVSMPQNLSTTQGRKEVFFLQHSNNDSTFQTSRTITVNDLRTLWNGRSRNPDSLRIAQLSGTFRVPSDRTARFYLAPELFRNPAYVTMIETITRRDSSSSRLGKTSAEVVLPQMYKLHQNYPNPFNPSTQLNFDLPEASSVSLVIYDVLGRKVAELVNGQVEAGYRSVTWNAANAASGVYFARFTAKAISGTAKYARVSKLILTK